jgi:hypothetical protein
LLNGVNQIAVHALGAVTSDDPLLVNHVGLVERDPDYPFVDHRVLPILELR